MRASIRLLASHTHKSSLLLPFPPPAAPGADSSGNSSAGSGSSSNSSSSSSKLPPAGTKAKTSSARSPTSSTSTSSLPRPRPDYTRILSSLSQTTLNHIQRASGLAPDYVSHISRLRSTQLELIRKLDSIRRKQNEIGTLIKTGLMEKDEGVRQAKKLKARRGEYEVNLGTTEEELLEMSLALPNFTSERTPIGKEDKAVEIDRFGPWAKSPAAELEVDPRRDHLRVAEYYGLLDNEASATATGSSWPYLNGAAALLEMALINYAMSKAISKGYTPVVPPDVIKIDVAQRCGFLPRDSGGAQQTFTLSPPPSFSSLHSESDSASTPIPTLCLAGTAEVPLAALYANRLLSHKDLPSKVIGVGHAFRAEAGARGADTRGLYRVHQFTKVELFAVTGNNEGGEEGVSDKAMEEMLEIQKDVLEGLGLSTRVLEMPTEELGATAFRKVDMEVWMPGRGKWGEVSSTSNCTDYQSRRLLIRYKPPYTPPPPGPELAQQGSPSTTSNEPLPFAHTLNGTAAAIPRLILALLENGVRLGKDGEIEGLDLPEALKRFWVGGGEMRGKDGKVGEIRWV